MAKQALEGIKVLDFTWMIAGAYATKILAEHGATVVKIESMSGVDLTRANGFKSARSVNQGALWTSNNDTKYGMTLDLHHPRAMEVVRRLVAWADIVAENFTPGRMEKWGLGYDDLRKIKSDIIFLRGGIHGQTGPSSAKSGFGTDLSTEVGFVHFLGYPDGEGLCAIYYTDFIAPWYMVSAAIGALNYRRKTGKGMEIDISQYEAGVSFLGPALLDYTANKRIETRMGNRHLEAAPHGAYRCKGDDRWCVIAVFNDDEWRALAEATNVHELAKDARFSTQALRKQNEDELDRLIEAWTVNYPPEEVMARLQAVGVAAGVVENGRDLANDPQMAHRQHLRPLQHPEMGVVNFDTPPFKLSKTPCELRVSPLMGQHTEYVCTQILGMSDAEFVELLKEGVFY